jgi:hypothetical protein
LTPQALCGRSITRVTGQQRPENTVLSAIARRFNCEQSTQGQDISRFALRFPSAKCFWWWVSLRFAESYNQSRGWLAGVNEKPSQNQPKRRRLGFSTEGSPLVTAGHRLILELTVISERYAGNLLNDKLADRRAGVQRDRDRPEIDQFKSDGASKASVDCWRREMHEQTCSGLGTPSFHPRGQSLFSINNRELYPLHCLAEDKLSRLENIGLFIGYLATFRIWPENVRKAAAAQIEADRQSLFEVGYFAAKMQVHRTCLVRAFNAW